MNTYEDISKPYPCLQNAEWWVTFFAGSLGVRFGPFDGAQCGQVASDAASRGIDCVITGNCGQTVDWKFAEDLTGNKRLCAAAPDLLAACEAFEGYYDGATDSPTRGMGEAYELACIAIAKATGKSL